MITITQGPLSPELKERIYEGFSRHAKAKTGFNKKGDPIALVATDPNGDFIGAIVMELFWGALHITYLFIEEPFRKQGFGRKLMEQAFAYGRENQCAFAFLETKSFQALGYYQKFGFELEYTRTGFSDNISFHYLKKDL